MRLDDDEAIFFQDSSRDNFENLDYFATNFSVTQLSYVELLRDGALLSPRL